MNSPFLDDIIRVAMMLNIAPMHHTKEDHRRYFKLSVPLEVESKYGWDDYKNLKIVPSLDLVNELVLEGQSQYIRFGFLDEKPQSWDFTQLENVWGTRSFGSGL